MANLADLVVVVRAKTADLEAGMLKTRHEITKTAQTADSMGRTYAAQDTRLSRYRQSLTGIGSAARQIVRGDVKAGMSGLSSAVGGLGSAGLVAAGGIAAAAGAVVALYSAAKKGVDAIKTIGGDLSTLKRITGLAGEDVAGLYGQFRMTGTDASAAATGIARFSKALEDARNGGQSLDTFRKLGVDVRDASGKMRDGNDVLADTRRRLSQIGDAYEFNARSQELFGRGFQTMAKWLKASQGDIARYDRIVAESGLKWGKGQQKTYANFIRNQREMQFRWQLMWAVLGQKILPILNRIVNKVLIPATRHLGTISRILDLIPGKARAIETAIKSMLGPIYPALQALSKMLEIIEKIKGEGVTNKDVRSAYGSVIGASPFGDVIKAIVPGMATGGYVDPRPGGTLVRLGEGGEREYVTPASQRGGGVAFHNCTFSATSPRELADLLGRETALAMGGLA